MAKYLIEKTCYACPEQYDIYDKKTGEQVGYLRLRHGYFYAAYPDVSGEIVYSAATIGDGMFDSEEERKFHLQKALTAIDKEVSKSSV